MVEKVGTSKKLFSKKLGPLDHVSTRPVQKARESSLGSSSAADDHDFLMASSDDIPAAYPNRNHDWLKAWREIAAMTSMILNANNRSKDGELSWTALGPLLDQCDTAFAADNWEGFQAAAALVRAFISTHLLKPANNLTLQTGRSIKWQGWNGVRGPAVIEEVIEDNGELWAFLVWQGVKTYVSERVILPEDQKGDSK